MASIGGYSQYARRPTQGGARSGTVASGIGPVPGSTQQGAYNPYAQPSAPPPPQMPYQPEAPRAREMVGELSQAGTGLLDPTSAYSRRMRNEISEGIGQQTQAQQRGAALRAAQSGLGYGASPELLETQGEIGREGLRAAGQADANAVLGSMELGGKMLAPALSGEIGLQGQQLSGFMGQQQLGQNQAMQDQRLSVQSQLQQQALQQEAYLREMALLGSFGGFGGF